MLRLTSVVLLYILAFWSGLAQAAPGAVVEAIQGEAKIQRSGAAFEALTVGMSVQTQDRIVTGPQARVLLRFPDQTQFRLGANAEVSLEQLSLSDNPDSGVSGLIHVLRGAFRFISPEDSKTRLVDIKMGSSITLGVRGTDTGGEINDDDSFVIYLLRGKIIVSYNGKEYTVKLRHALRGEVGAEPEEEELDDERQKQETAKTDLAAKVAAGGDPDKIAMSIEEAQALVIEDPESAPDVAADLIAAGYDPVLVLQALIPLIKDDNTLVVNVAIAVIEEMQDLENGVVDVSSTLGRLLLTEVIPEIAPVFALAVRDNPELAILIVRELSLSAPRFAVLIGQSIIISLQIEEGRLAVALSRAAVIPMPTVATVSRVQVSPH